MTCAASRPTPRRVFEAKDRVLRWQFETEPEALGMVERLLRADTAGQWREQERGGPPESSR